MHDSAEVLSSAQLEAKSILSGLVQKLSEPDSKYYTKYGTWIERHPRLEDFCFSRVRPQIWSFLNGRWSLDALKVVGGDLKFEGRGVYLDGVLGLDRKVRIYIGQASSIRQRVAQHLNFRYRRDNPSLHYHAMQQSIYNSIGLVAQLPPPNMESNQLPGMDHPELLLNLMEMWMCLVFRTLPPQTLQSWLPDDASINKGYKKGKEGEFGWLNLASPLDHGQKEREWIDLSETGDPLLRDYLGLGRQIDGAEQEKRSDVQDVILKQNNDEKADTAADTRKAYAERARSFNRKMNHREMEPSQALGLVFAAGLGVLIGITLMRISSGQRPGTYTR